MSRPHSTSLLKPQRAPRLSLSPYPGTRWHAAVTPMPVWPPRAGVLSWGLLAAVLQASVSHSVQHGGCGSPSSPGAAEETQDRRPRSPPVLQSRPPSSLAAHEAPAAPRYHKQLRCPLSPRALFGTCPPSPHSGSLSDTPWAACRPCPFQCPGPSTSDLCCSRNMSLSGASVITARSLLRSP